MARCRVCTRAGVFFSALAILLALTALFFGVYLNKNGSSNKGARPTVTVRTGILEGEWLSGAQGDDFKFASFRGIPYAQPPVGALRFKAPRPAFNWTGIRQAKEEGSECMQQSLVTGKMVGSEDCLFLNVYSPRLPTNDKKLPVYFFVYGGAFITGSSTRSLYGPEFFMLNDIVVVTVNYRVNVFGFLNLDDDNVPGNAGIKDLIAALKWVRRNIAAFGGDPNSITVGGQSSGAAAAHWLTLLPESRDLIRGVALESGSATHSWAYNEDNFDVALDLGRRLPGAPDNLQDISRLVMELSAETIMQASIPMANQRMMDLATQIPYATSPERSKRIAIEDQPLIKQDPERYVLDHSLKSVPMFMGMNSREYLAGFYTYGYAANPDKMHNRIAHLENTIPKNIIPFRDTLSFLNLTKNTFPSFDDVLLSVGDHFFKRNDTSCDETCTFKKYLDDISFGVDCHRLAELRARAKRSNTFVYRFGIRTAYSASPLYDEDQRTGGAVHADELGYLWKMKRLPAQKLEGDGIASTTLLRMTSMMSSFIKTGYVATNSYEGSFTRTLNLTGMPFLACRSPMPSKEIFNGTWLPTEKRETNIIFMDIGQDLHVKEGYLGGTEIPFWLKVYQTQRGFKSV
ncbi:hypothetical protein ONE63_000613 [Megalurothrips usitatus]|uniref:Carboxylic ester hydrolase n=1 Tax=Megalurothrips usitatus TaxID=439358 RepID=A0AAV7Y636_9NEOP|nr:hypothetical protein ONE63_000613 [Megalurothrips usitatus]